MLREILVYSLAAIAVIGMIGYSVHMLVGDIVSPDTERWLIIAACAIAVAVIGAMAVDVIKRRRHGLS